MIKNKHYLINYFLITLSTTLSIYIYFSSNNSYRNMYILPIIYTLCFVFSFSRLLFKSKNPFYYVFVGVSFFRYIVLPGLITYTSYYSGRSLIPPTDESISLAIMLISYELIAISIYIRYKTKKSIEYSSKNIEYSNKNIIYILFVFFSISLLVIRPDVLKYINIIKPSYLMNEINLSTIDNLIIYIFIVAKQLLFIILSSKLSNLYKKSKKNIFVLLNVLVLLLNITIYFGTNRSDVLITAIVSLILLYRLYGKQVLPYIIITSIVIVLLVLVITKSRQMVSISKGTSKLIDFTDMVQAYTGGIYNVAIAIETKIMFPEASSLIVLLFDIFRPMLGINLFLKNMNVNYSNIYFNKRMWINIDRRSQIIPMVGQSYLFFGRILSPIISLFTIKIMYSFEKIRMKTDSIELYYFLTLVLTRFGFMMGQNTMNLINDLSYNLFLFALIYIANKYFYKRRSSI